MKFLLVVIALFSSSIFLSQLSNAIHLEFDVSNHFNLDYKLDILLEAKMLSSSSSSEHGTMERKVPNGKALHWNIKYDDDVRHYPPWMKFECSVYVCMLDGSEVLLDSFIAFDSKWFETPLIEEKFQWSVTQEGASLLSPPLEHPKKHSWQWVFLIFEVKNSFSSHEDIAVSIHTKQEMVPSQERVPYRHTLVVTKRIETDKETDVVLKCSFRSPFKMGQFKIFDSSFPFLKEEMFGIRKYDWSVTEERATMVYPQRYEVELV